MAGWSKFFQFHAVFGKIWQNRMLVHLPPPPPRGLTPPPRGNSGAATEHNMKIISCFSFKQTHEHHKNKSETFLTLL